MIVELTQAQIDEAREIGARRYAHNRSLGISNGHMWNGDLWDREGAIGEMAVALQFGLKWSDFSENYWLYAADVGDGYQVRSTSHPYGNLLLQRKDNGDQPYILARLHALPKVELVGWIYGRDGKKPEYWEDGSKRPAFKGRAAFLFPAWKLNSMASLPGIK
jgi:hypothetical protein